MTKKLYPLAAASLITAATLISAQAATPPTTNATVLEKINVSLTVYSQGAASTNKAGTVITDTVTTSTLNTEDVLSALKSATGYKFHTNTASLVYYYSYQDTNVYEYSVASTNTSAVKTNGVSTNFFITQANTNYEFIVSTPFITSTITNKSILGYILGSNFGIVSTNFTNSEFVPGVTNMTEFQLTAIKVVWTNAPNSSGLEVVDGTNYYPLTNTTIYSTLPNEPVTTNDAFSVFSFRAASSVITNITDKATNVVNGGVTNDIILIATESGIIYGSSSLSLNSPGNWVLNGLTGFASATVSFNNNLGTSKTNRDVETFSENANVAGSGYMGGTFASTNIVGVDITNTYYWVTNAVPFITEGTLTTSFWKTRINQTNLQAPLVP